MNKMIIVLLGIVVLIQIITAIINIIVQFALKRKDGHIAFVAETYSIIRSVYEKIYNSCKNVYRNIITSSDPNAVNVLISDLILLLSTNDIYINKKMQSLSEDMIDKLQQLNLNRTDTNNKELQKAFSKYKAEFKNHDNY